MLSKSDRPTAYSYVRFSTKKQELGDSVRRQVDMAEAYARSHNLQLSPETYRDLGVSSFKQRNVKNGALAAFIAAVKSGAVAPGSFLLIEQFDRLSRAQVTVALRLLLDLVEQGITVVTLVDEKVWNADTVEDITNVLTSIILMGRAHEESRSKSRRLREVWSRKKELAQAGSNSVVTAECPRWLAPAENRAGFVILEDKAESVRKVFAARTGGLGVTAIVRIANEEKWPVPGKRPVRQEGDDDITYNARVQAGMTWHSSLVGRLLKNRAVLGEYQPHKTEYVESKDEAARRVRVPAGMPVSNYYPAIISEEQFHRAQAVSGRRGRFPGRRDGALRNWLQGLLRCGLCGHTMTWKNKESKSQPGYARYYCSARIRGASRCPSVSSFELEGGVLTVVSVLAPSFWDGATRSDSLRSKADLLQVELSNAAAARDSYLHALGLASQVSSQALIVGKLEECSSRIESLNAELAKVMHEISDTPNDPDELFDKIAEKIQSLSSPEDRAALREDLSRVFSKIEVFADQSYIRTHLRAGDVPVVQPLNVSAKLPGLGAYQAPLEC